jgi:hypothetical protein
MQHTAGVTQIGVPRASLTDSMLALRIGHTGRSGRRSNIIGPPKEDSTLINAKRPINIDGWTHRLLKSGLFELTLEM